MVRGIDFPDNVSIVLSAWPGTTIPKDLCRLYSVAWVAEHTTRVVMNLNHNTDREIIKRLSEEPSKQGYIKRLIREDIARTTDRQ